MHSRIYLIVALSTLFLAAACADDPLTADPGPAVGPDSAIGSDSSDREAPHYVLVHGSWMGAWAWTEVAAQLRDSGAAVTVIELPGHGGDTTPVSELTLTLYAETVSAALDDAAGPSILVGHSMAGMIIAQVAEMRPQAIEQLVFVSAYLPRDGESLVDLASRDPDAITGEYLIFNDDGTLAVASEGLGEVFCGDCTAEILATLTDHYRDEPTAPLSESVALSAENFGAVAKVYIETVQDRAVSLALQQQMVSDTPVDRVISLDTGHLPMLVAPESLSEELIALAIE
ncbi:MAG: alpha/beta fold hydrolase [Myxococcota bacterium]